MKTFKLVMALCVVTLFTVGITYAQPAKVTTVYTFPVRTYVLCGPEFARGTVTQEITNFGNGHFMLKNSFSMVGETSFALYEAEVIINDHVVDPERIGTYTRTVVVKRNGAPHALQHQTFHVTYNENGELTADVSVNKLHCF